jgi:hypothetical protein
MAKRPQVITKKNPNNNCFYTLGDLGFRPLTVGRISTLYLDIAYRQYMQAYYYSKTQGEERLKVL